MLGYIIQKLVKAQYKAESLTQKAIKKKYQLFQDTKAKSKFNHKLESQLAEQNTILRSKALCAQNTTQNSKKQILDKDNNNSNCHSANVSTKHKWKKTKTFEKHAAKKQKRYNTELSQEKSSKSIKLHFLRDVDFKVRVQHENVKKIFEQELIF